MNYHVRTYRAQRRRREIAQWARLFFLCVVIFVLLTVFHAAIAG